MSLCGVIIRRRVCLLLLCSAMRVAPVAISSTTVFSHAQTVVQCAGCDTILCHPTGGKARLTEGCSFRKR